ncbi:MAG: hypothetical protein QQN63_11940 [Nitrosopumilus sp.]
MPKAKSSSSRFYLGLDPGVTGGLVSLRHGRVLEIDPMPKTEADIWKWMTGYTDTLAGFEVVPVFATIEWIHPAILGVGKSSMSKLYGNYMALRAFLTAAEIPFEDVKPVVWQRAMGIPVRKPHTKKREVEITKGKNKGKMRIQNYGGETDTQWKNRLKAKAQQLFPSKNITLATADALLIAEFCRRKHEGIL